MKDDLISRQAAIDALAENMPSTYTPDGSHPADEGIFMAQEIYADCIQTLKELPSAQPEIIYCKDCKHYVLRALFGRSFGLCERLCNESHSILTESNDFCSHAERRKQ